MALCPTCNTPGAYIGFSSVECRNPQCEHFRAAVETICPCCGKVGHTPSEQGAAAADGSAPGPSNGAAPSSLLDGDPATMPG